ncbi:phosphonate ABC transporter ATP-binding protein, partial [Enterococcus faecalis]|uniref:phosphonate ABC transporter ATP-binding protein n=1 Tax=Enterococcus faecalis TaxID=1351 RepID=UPI0039A47F53
VVGLSGAGKSTMLRSINRLHEITSGEILIDNRSITKAKGKELRLIRRDIGMIFQSFNLVKRSSVLRNVLTGRVAYHPTLQMLLGLFPQADKELAYQSLQRVNLAEKVYSRADQLSGGQQQRVAITRALVQNPEVLLLDEPLSNLDARLRLKIREEIRRLVKEVGITTIFVTHDQEEALSISDKIILMNEGVIQQNDDPQNLYLEPNNLFVAKFIGNPIIN